MIRIILGILIGAVGVYTFINGTDDIAQKAKSSVHSVATEVANATKPTSQSRMGSFVDNFIRN